MRIHATQSIQGRETDFTKCKTLQKPKPPKAGQLEPLHAPEGFKSPEETKNPKVKPPKLRELKPMPAPEGYKSLEETGKPKGKPRAKPKSEPVQPILEPPPGYKKISSWSDILNGFSNRRHQE